jgi:hypothetical protein
MQNNIYPYTGHYWLNEEDDLTAKIKPVEETLPQICFK